MARHCRRDRRLVVADGQESEEHGTIQNFLRIGKASQARERENPAFRAVFQAVSCVEPVAPKAMSLGLWRLEIKQVKGASRNQDAMDLMQRLLLLVRAEMVEHEGGEYTIKRRVRVRQLIRKALVELDGDGCPFCFSSGSSEGPGIGIESDDLDIRMKTLDQRGQRPRATADVEDTMAAADGGLIEERPSCGITAQQFRKRIVEG